MKLTNENTSRKVDALGRIIIPKGLRDRLSINPEDMLDFFVLDDGERMYVCMTNQTGVSRRYKIAAEVLAELGFKVPQEIQDKT